MIRIHLMLLLYILIILYLISLFPILFLLFTTWREEFRTQNVSLINSETSLKKRLISVSFQQMLSLFSGLVRFCTIVRFLWLNVPVTISVQQVQKSFYFIKSVRKFNVGITRLLERETLHEMITRCHMQDKEVSVENSLQNIL